MRQGCFGRDLEPQEAHRSDRDKVAKSCAVVPRIEKLATPVSLVKTRQSAMKHPAALEFKPRVLREEYFTYEI